MRKEGTHMSVGERDFASLILRTAIGPMLIAHGTNKVFGSGGLEGTTRWFDSLGLQPAAVHARSAPGRLSSTQPGSRSDRRLLARVRAD